MCRYLVHFSHLPQLHKDALNYSIDLIVYFDKLLTSTFYCVHMLFYSNVWISVTTVILFTQVSCEKFTRLCSFLQKTIKMLCCNFILYFQLISSFSFLLILIVAVLRFQYVFFAKPKNKLFINLF